MSDELEEQEKTVEDGELADDFSDDMPDDDDIEDSEVGEIFDEDGENFDEDDDDFADEEASPKEENGDDDEDDDEVEADLTDILQERITSEDDEDSEEKEPSKTDGSDEANVVAKQEDEINCPSCFLLVSQAALEKDGECPHCGALS